MRIHTGNTKDASQVDLNQAPGTRDISAATEAGASAASASLGFDSIALTGASGLVSMVLNSGTEARSLRIAQLKAQIDGNTYAVDPAAVSRALIDAHLTD
jgi:anti-sigma28 factor (negative regulator of flagellin synthesis)